MLAINKNVTRARLTTKRAIWRGCRWKRTRCQQPADALEVAFAHVGPRCTLRIFIREERFVCGLHGEVVVEALRPRVVRRKADFIDFARSSTSWMIFLSLGMTRPKIVTVRWLLPFFLAALAFAQTEPRVELSHTTEGLRGVSAVSRRVAWASGTHGTYLRTTDAGAHWESAQVPGAEALDFRGVVAFSADEAFLMSAGPGELSRIYHTG